MERGTVENKLATNSAGETISTLHRCYLSQSIHLLFFSMSKKKNDKESNDAPNYNPFPSASFTHRSCASFQSYPQKYLFNLLVDTTGLGVVGSIVGLGGWGPLVINRASHGVFVKHISPRGQSFRFPLGQCVVQRDIAS